MGCGPVRGGRTERLHLGRGPRVRRPPGDRPEKRTKKKKTKQRSSVRRSDTEAGGPITGGTAPIIPLLLSEDGRVFSRFPSRVQEEFTAHTLLQTALLSMFQTLKYSKAPALKRKANSCGITAAESSAFVSRRAESPLSPPSSKLACSFFSQPAGSVRGQPRSLQQLTFAGCSSVLKMSGAFMECGQI